MSRLVLAAALLAAACGPARQPVSVEVDWTFGGQPCDKAGVATIQIDITGEVLSPNQFICKPGAPNDASFGVDLGSSFWPGSYTTRVTGLDASGNVIYDSTQVIQVRNIPRNVIPFDVAPTTGTVTLRWTLSGKTCDAAGVTTVRVSVDNQVITDAQNNPALPCKSTTIEGTTIGPLSPGSHTFALAAQSSSGANYEVSNLNTTVTAGQDTLLPADLQPATPTAASADVRWSFLPGPKSCLDVGADHLYVIFDPNPDGSGGTQVADMACAGMGGAAVSEVQIVDIRPDGNHSFAVRATKQNNLIAYTHHPVTTLFTAPFTTAVNVTLEGLP